MKGHAEGERESEILLGRVNFRSCESGCETWRLRAQPSGNKSISRPGDAVPREVDAGTL